MALSAVLWDEGLAADIYQVLRDKERQLPTYYAQSPELHMRRHLVNWMSIIWEKYQLCHMARHLAVCLLDFMMDRFSIDGRQIYLVAIGCILVASKFEEQEIKIPRGCDLNNLVESGGFSNQEYCSVELTILDFFKWNINIPTAAHFTDYFIKISVSSNSDQTPPHSGMSAKLIHQYVNYFLEISLQDHYYRDFPPSQIAAACVACTRVIDQTMPAWNCKLQEASGYLLKDLQPLVEKLLKTHREDEALQEATSGMLTPPATPQNRMTGHPAMQTNVAMGIAPAVSISACLGGMPQPAAYSYVPTGGTDGGSFLDVTPYSPTSPTHEVIYISDSSPAGSDGYDSVDKDVVSMVTVIPSNYVTCYTTVNSSFLPPPGRIQ